ncbi:MAG: PRD domain-containing protein [Liquorilactobacillus nagelii]|jgi:beta-glucoside operon transcriptional antiterminator|uniref:BglG family transcription antiterminator LicT n=2 Tax=Liquorilactobacillus nagelii TaxID=82688 RepID=UPI001CC9FF15|nr:PRD domain-containing protein [Liquorilactobacillus nagelii]MCI1920702.1 PRD domain-containing protein [Liquorilactobacillus nagelii]MCI1977732.1 PRD domain-containing protein [Liquorilactobacillus nagelii]ULQ49566.1 PRD domain-containing protein [Liquorilactobacillus nagelii]
MKIIKIFNNNVVLADQNSHQIVLIGKGLGFQKKPGMTIQSEKIEQIYAPTESKWFSLFNDLLKDISPEYLEIAAQIIHLAEAKLETKFNEYLLISLMDHIHFAVVRHQQQIDIHNEILWEVKHYYPTEFQVGQTALGIINQRLGVRLTDDEAGFIALKFVESGLNHPQSYDTVALTKMIGDVIQIVQFQLQVTLDTDSISYRRFLVHLRFLAERIIKPPEKDAASTEDDIFLFEHIKRKYQTAFACTQKVVNFIADSMHQHLSYNEQVYLTIHVQRIINDLTK